MQAIGKISLERGIHCCTKLFYFFYPTNGSILCKTCVCVCVCVCVVCVCGVCVCVCVCVCLCVCVFVCVCVVCLCVCVFVFAFVCVCVCVCVYIYLITYTPYEYVYELQSLPSNTAVKHFYTNRDRCKMLTGYLSFGTGLAVTG